MRFILTTILLALPLLATGQSSEVSGPSEYNNDPFASHMMQVQNPCKDSLYLELKKKDLDEMSEREYEVFKQKDKACQDYMNTVTATEPANKNAESIDRATNAATTYYIVGGIISLASLIYILSI